MGVGLGVSAAVGLLWGALTWGAGAMAQSAPPTTRDNVLLAGRTMSCSGVRTQLDAALPNYGIAVPEQHLVVINPRLVAQQPSVVQWFVFAHECGHHHVGGNEMVADCWATRRGVADGWLDKSGLKHICRSFGGGPATETHPAASNRCANLDRCFEVAFAAHRNAVSSPAIASVDVPEPSDRTDSANGSDAVSAYAPDFESRERASPTAQMD